MPKTSLLVSDGFTTTDLPMKFSKASLAFSMFDRYFSAVMSPQQGAAHFLIWYCMHGRSLFLSILQLRNGNISLRRSSSTFICFTEE